MNTNRRTGGWRPFSRKESSRKRSEDRFVHQRVHSLSHETFLSRWSTLTSFRPFVLVLMSNMLDTFQTRTSLASSSLTLYLRRKSWKRVVQRLAMKFLQLQSWCWRSSDRVNFPVNWTPLFHSPLVIQPFRIRYPLEFLRSINEGPILSSAD